MQEIKQINRFAKLSLLSATLTVILASITHAYEFGYRTFIAGFIVVFILSVLNIRYQRTMNKVFLLFYELLNVWIIIAFGLINGLWNHTFKAFLIYLHNGYLPSLLTRLFLDPKLGSFFFESIATLTFIASMFTAYYGYKLVLKKQNNN